ncbi:hypothetical protein ZYGR_0A01640 [Zygosaccharomyces rouxii]|uniref:Uncharacterized protein n=1 Tax=Zygosaccharomyces rouxii TaxID=4956 RepID=A0A1Q2ZSV5_ZYGRO|nr:hypothetical protein ZYGR_0A01640 [Zygosaccharomyces rouxii]
MRRSVTTYQPASHTAGLKRASTTSAVSPLSHVEERLGGLELVEAKSDVEEASYEPAQYFSNREDEEFAGIKYTALPGSSGTEQEEANNSSSQNTEVQANCESSFHSNNSTLGDPPSSSSEYEGDLEDGSYTDTLSTSVNDSLPPENVHKPLKDLIFKANKEAYDVDSNKVRIKVGLSKKVPSLHPRRKINGASSLQ